MAPKLEVQRKKCEKCGAEALPFAPWALGGLSQLHRRCCACVPDKVVQWMAQRPGFLEGKGREPLRDELMRLGRLDHYIKDASLEEPAGALPESVELGKNETPEKAEAGKKEAAKAGIQEGAAKEHKPEAAAAILREETVPQVEAGAEKKAEEAKEAKEAEKKPGEGTKKEEGGAVAEEEEAEEAEEEGYETEYEVWDETDKEALSILGPDKADRLHALRHWKVPIGKYQGRPLHELPKGYAKWAKEQEEPTPPLQAIINSIEEMQALEEELRELQEKAEQEAREPGAAKRPRSPSRQPEGKPAAAVAEEAGSTPATDWRVPTGKWKGKTLAEVPHSYIRWCEGHPGALPHIPQMFERIKELRDAGLPVGTDNPPAPATPAKEGARPGRRRKAE